MDGKIFTFIGALDATMLIAKDIATLLGNSQLVKMFTDSKQLFDALIREKRTAEKKLHDRYFIALGGL